MDNLASVEWAKNGSIYQSRSRADKVPALDPGLYVYASTMSGWILRRQGDGFHFPFKIYDPEIRAVDRICTFYQESGSLGAWFTGIRGGGKTVSAQMVANRLIAEHGLPVLLVSSPIPLGSVLDTIRQDVVILFDEFEKTHDAEDQHHLLSVVDGLSRTEFARVFLFTTNSTKIDENFTDRPSRIRYVFKFNRASQAVVNGLLDDMLSEDLFHLRDALLSYFDSREELTIDIIKQTIREAVLFKETPLDFAKFFNVKESTPPTFQVFLVDPETGENLEKMEDFFHLSSPTDQGLLMGHQHAVEDFNRDGRPFVPRSDSGSSAGIDYKLLRWNSELNAFEANVKVPLRKTHWAPYAFYLDPRSYYKLWLQPEPEGYKALPPPKAFGKRLKGKDLEELDKRSALAFDEGTVYGDHTKSEGADGSSSLGLFLVRFVITRERPQVHFSKSFGYSPLEELHQ